MLVPSGRAPYDSGDARVDPVARANRRLGLGSDRRGCGLDRGKLVRQHIRRLEARWPPSCSCAHVARRVVTAVELLYQAGHLTKARPPVQQATLDLLGIEARLDWDLLLRERRGARRLSRDGTRATIPTAYEAVDVRRDAYEVLYALWPERGPFTGFDRVADAPR
jgi:hypothetical protein